MVKANKKYIIKSYKGYWHNNAGWIDYPEYATVFEGKNQEIEERIKGLFYNIKISYIPVEKIPSL